MSWYGDVIDHILIKCDIVHNRNHKYETNAYAPKYHKFVQENIFNLYLEAEYLVRFLTAPQRAYVAQRPEEALISSDYLIQQLDLDINDEAEFHYRFLSFIGLLTYVKPASNFFQKEELFVNEVETEDMHVMRMTINLCILTIFARTLDSNMLSDTQATVLGDIVARFQDLFSAEGKSCPSNIAYHIVIDLLLYYKFPKEMSTLSLEQMRSRVFKAESILKSNDVNDVTDLWKVAGIEKNDISNSALSKLRKVHDLKNMRRMLLAFVLQEYSKLSSIKPSQLDRDSTPDLIAGATAQLRPPSDQQTSSDARHVISGLLEKVKTGTKNTGQDKILQTLTETNLKLQREAHEAWTKLNRFESRRSTYTEDTTEKLLSSAPYSYDSQVPHLTVDERYGKLIHLLQKKEEEIIKVSEENQEKAQQIERLEKEHTQKVDEMNKVISAKEQKLAELERASHENVRLASSRYTFHVLERKLEEAEEQLNHFRNRRLPPFSPEGKCPPEANQSTQIIQELSSRLHQCMYTVSLKEARIGELDAYIADLKQQLGVKDQFLSSAQQLIERQKVHLLQLGNDYFSASHEKESLKQKLKTLTNRDTATNSDSPKLLGAETKLMRLENELSNSQKMLKTRTAERDIQNNTIVGLQSLLRTREQDLQLIVNQERHCQYLISEKDRQLGAQDRTASNLRLRLSFASHNVVSLHQLLPVQKVLGSTTNLESINFQTDIKTLYVVNNVMDKIRFAVSKENQDEPTASASGNKDLEFPMANHRPIQEESDVHFKGQLEHGSITHTTLGTSQKLVSQRYSTTNGVDQTNNLEPPSKRIKTLN